MGDVIYKAISANPIKEGGVAGIDGGKNIVSKGGTVTPDSWIATTNDWWGDRFVDYSDTANNMGVPVSAADVNIPASGNTAAVVTYAAAGAGKRHFINGVTWSYNIAPSNGVLRIEDGANNIVFSTAISNAGPGFIPFEDGKLGSENTLMRLTLTSGGVGASGQLSVLGHRIQ